MEKDYKLVKLDKTNYLVWKWQFINVLRANDLESVIPSPTDEVKVLPANLLKKDSQAMALLGSALTEENALKVINCTTFAHAWRTIEQCHEIKTSFEPQSLFQKLNGYKIRHVNDVSKGVSEMLGIVAQLRNLGEEVSENNLMGAILSALPSSFEIFVTVWKNSPSSERTVDNLIARIMSDASDLARSEESNTSRALYVSKGKKKYPKNVDKDACRYCKEKGHFIEKCPKLKEPYDPNYSKKKKKERSNKSPNDKQTKEESCETNPKEIAFAVRSKSCATDKFLWVADTGCSNHMSPFRELFTNYHEVEHPRQVELCDSSKTKLEVRGSGSIMTKVGKLSEVLYVPELGQNLFSVPAAAANGLNYVGSHDKIAFYHEGVKLFEATLKDQLYFIKFEPTNYAANSATLSDWHARFGHASIDTIKKMINGNLVEGLEIADRKRDQCIDCLLGKCKRTSHPSRSTLRSKTPGTSLHVDTMGPIRPQSKGGANYSVLCKDEASGYRLIGFVSDKTEVANEVKIFVSRSEFETARKVLRLTSDNGSEYVNQNLGKFLKERGIIHNLSTAYVPQQNGLIERDIRTIAASARTMLVKSKMAKNLWAEAMNSAVYALNRVIGASHTSKTPYEMWFGHKPNVRNLRIFGQHAILKKPDRYIEGKWDERGMIGRFVGYTELTNTYRFLCNNSIVTSCDTVFIDDPIEEEDEEVPEITVSGIVSSDEQDEQGIAKASEESFEEATADMNEPIYDVPNLEVWNDDSLIESDDDNQGAPTTPPRTGKHNVRGPDGRFIKAPNAPKRQTGNPHAMMIVSNQLPQTHEEAMKREDAPLWKAAMEEELKSLIENSVFVVVKRPKTKVISSRWVLTIKYKSDGSVDKYKARIVARGYAQVYGMDYNETYSPVVHGETVKLLLGAAAHNNWHIKQFDVKTAFLYGNLDEVIYLEEPDGFKTDKDNVWLLKRSLYGLKQSPRCWNRKFDAFLKESNLTVSKLDPCVYYRHNPLVIVTIYVDDGLIFSNNQNEIDQLLKLLKAHFKIHLLDLTTYLGLQILDRGDGIIIHQNNYVNDMLTRFNMDACKPVPTPATQIQKSEVNNKLRKEIPYREAVGSLSYLAMTTRLDIAYAVNQVARHSADPSEADWKDVKRIMRYLKGSKEMGIKYPRENSGTVEAYCDADFCGDKDKCKSTTGFVINYSGAPFTWKSKRQSLVTLNSTEAESVSICTTTKELTWLKQVALELDIMKDEPIVLRSDNTSAIKISSSEKISHRTRHLGAQFEYVRQEIKRKNIKLEYVKAENQLADFLTKPLPTTNFLKNRNALMIMFILMVVGVLGVTPEITKYDVVFMYDNPCNEIMMDNQRNVLQMRQEINKECDHLFRNYWMDAIDNLLSCPSNKRKRSPLEAIKEIAIAGISNLVASKTITLLPSHTTSNTQLITRLKEELYQLNNDVDLLKSYKHEIAHEIEMISETASHHKRELEYVVNYFPKLMWSSFHIYTKIMAMTADIRFIASQCRKGIMATSELGELLNSAEIKAIDPATTIWLGVRVDTNTLRFNFGVTKVPKEPVEDNVRVNWWLVIVISLSLSNLACLTLTLYQKLCGDRKNVNLRPLPPTPNEEEAELHG